MVKAHLMHKKNKCATTDRTSTFLQKEQRHHHKEQKYCKLVAKVGQIKLIVLILLTCRTIYRPYSVSRIGTVDFSSMRGMEHDRKQGRTLVWWEDERDGLYKNPTCQKQTGGFVTNQQNINIIFVKQMNTNACFW